MHYRDMMWTTIDGTKIPLSKISSKHLENINIFFNKNYDMYVKKFGNKQTQLIKKNIKKELIYRKLNNIEINSNDELF